jgi:hypothetical protein
MSDPIPATYADWRRCIEVDCGIALTAAFINERLAALGNLRDEHTRRFCDLYGDAHLATVVRWFEQAKDQLPRGARA